MKILDFKEIAQANLPSTGNQDQFELFARDFLSAIGYTIERDPFRGADGGADLIVSEVRSGVGGTTKIKWLVSCKHNAHSGKAVSERDEFNIRDRIEKHNCDGFMGFYSTLMSSGLSSEIESLRKKFECQVFDSQKIENCLLLDSSHLKQMAKQYFPKSMANIVKNNPEHNNIFGDFEGIKCSVCHCDLVVGNFNDVNGVVFFLGEYVDSLKHLIKIDRVRFSCGSGCSNIITKESGYVGGYKIIKTDMLNPVLFFNWILMLISDLVDGKVIVSKSAFNEMYPFLKGVIPYISRPLSDDEENFINSINPMTRHLIGVDGGLRTDCNFTFTLK